MDMKVYGCEEDVRVKKVLAVAAFAECPIDATGNFQLGKDNMSKEFLKMSPMGRIPVMCTDTATLFESNSIIRHIARTRPVACLYGEDGGIFGASQVDQWIDFVTNEVEIPCCCLVSDKCQAIAAKAKQDVTQALKAIEPHLTEYTFLGKQHICIADVSLAVIIHSTAKHLDLDALPAPILRWYHTISGHKAFTKTMGSDVKGDQKTRRDKKPSKDVVEESPEEPKPAPKRDEPLDLLPPSTMDLNEWKRVYSNTKDLLGVAMPWLWENFDAEGYSFWWMKYEKLEGECEVSFITSNQLGGFLLRTDNNFRKYSFAVLNVMGVEKDYDIQGVWMLRGQDLPFQVTDHPSYDYHTWRKLDHNKQEDKKLIVDYFCNDNDIEGIAIADCKVWK